jgi:C-terminal processing protease CtpA/Prc
MSMEAGPSKAGVGITLKANSEGDFVVEKVLSGGGASLEQVIKGDVLRAVDGVPIAGRSLNEAQDLLTGVAGTFVQLHLDRPKLKSTYQVTFSCSHLQTSSVQWSSSSSWLSLLPDFPASEKKSGAQYAPLLNLLG